MGALPGSGGSGEVGGDDVGGVAVEGAAGAVVAAGLARVGVPGEVLHIPQAAPRVEGGGDRRLTQVRERVTDAGLDPATVDEAIEAARKVS
jgi:hypothetical protein